ncbi:MAG: hypothetical protein ACK5LS_13790, partial [Propioniciclava sp.]
AWPGALVVLGIVLIVLGVALLGLAAAAAQRQEVTVVLDEDGYAVVEPAGTRRGRWEEVTRVTGVPGRITLHRSADERVVLVVAVDRSDQLDEVAADIARRLDAQRGYRNLP